MVRFNPRLTGNWMKVFIGLVALCFVAVLFREQWLLLIGDFLVVEDTLQSADVIHVIAGDDYRTEYALQLYKQGYGKILFFTGGWCTFHNYYHGKHAEELSFAQDVSLEAIAFDDSTVTSTYMEVEKLQNWIAHSPYPIRSVIVVSDPFHMRRARWSYQKVFGDNVKMQMAPVPYDLTPYQRRWWTDHESQNYVWEEYRKYLYYIFRYQISWGRFQEWLTSLDQE